MPAIHDHDHDAARRQSIIAEAANFGIGEDTQFINFALDPERGFPNFKSALQFYALEVDKRLSRGIERSGVTTRDAAILRGEYNPESTSDSNELEKAKFAADAARAKADELTQKMVEKSRLWSELLDRLPILKHVVASAAGFADTEAARAVADPTQVIEFMGPYSGAETMHCHRVVEGIALAKLTAPLYRVIADRAAENLKAHIAALRTFAKANNVPRDVWPEEIA